MISKHEMSNIEAPQTANESLTIPEYLICPITQLIFLEPVTVFPTGRVYEKEVIVRLLQEAAKKGQPLLCPLNREPIIGYAKAYNIETAVEDYLKVNTNVRNQQYQRESSEHETIKTANSAATSSHPHTNNQQIANDAALARTMQERVIEQRDRQSAAALRQQREREQRARESQLNATRNQQARTELEKNKLYIMY